LPYTLGLTPFLSHVTLTEASTSIYRYSECWYFHTGIWSTSNPNWWGINWIYFISFIIIFQIFITIFLFYSFYIDMLLFRCFYDWKKNLDFFSLMLSMYWCCHLAKEELKSNRIHRRIFELLSKAATSRPRHAGLNQRRLHFVFFRKPDSFQESKDNAGHVSGMRFEKTVLKGNFHFL
jgi:hypothetical protein